MTLQHALGYLDEISDYQVKLLDRIKVLAPDEVLGSDIELSYSWSGGYEVMKWHRAGVGSSDYRGSYHPNDGMCETGTSETSGVCIRCGRTM